MQNNKIDIYFFTGTGNTYLAAKKIADVLTKAGSEARLLNIENSKPENIDLGRTIGIAYPTACWNTYPFVNRFINSLPKANGTPAFVFTTMGNSSFKSPDVIAIRLAAKGYKIIAAESFKSPNNWIMIENDKKQAVKIERASSLAAGFAKKIAEGTAEFKKPGILHRVGFVISSFVTRRWEKKIWQRLIRFKADKKLCTKCGLCVKICPVKNISMQDYPVFNGNKCQLCLRCFSYCPAKAIKSRVTGKKTYKALNNEEAAECFQRK